MTTLYDLYPGDRALDFVLIVVLGVTLLSGAAWFFSSRLPRQPAARHLILVSALLCSLGMPVLALIFSASGMTLITIPLLPATPARRDVVLPHVTQNPVGTTRQPAGVYPGMAIESQLAGSARFPFRQLDSKRAGPGPTTDAVRREPTTTVRRPEPSAVGREGVGDRAGWPAFSRGAAAVVLAVWACGSFLLLIGFARSCVLVSQLRRRSSPLCNESLHVLLDDVGRSSGIRRLPEVFVSRRVMMPFAVGVRRPAVILPERLIGAVSGEELRDVLLHEVAHVRRGDHLIVLLQELTRAMYWPIVPVHGLIRELVRAREDLCDNHVLQGRDAVSYGETLLHLAELSLAARPPVLSVGILHWRGELERRIAGLLDQKRSRMTRSSRWLACFVMLVFIGGGTIASATRFVAAGRKVESSSEAVAEPKPAQTPRGPAVPAPASNEPSSIPPSVAKQPEAAKRSMLIHVIGPDGRPMQGVQIHRSVWTKKPGNDRNLDVLSDEDGQVRVSVPEEISIFRLWARAEGHVPLFAHWEEQDNPETTLPEEFTFRLKPGTVIGGIIRDQNGQAIKGATVEVQLQHGGEQDGRAGPDMWLAEGSDASTTDAEGRWTLKNVPPGNNVEVLLKLGHPDFISDPNWGTLQKEQGITTEALRAGTATIKMRGGLGATGTITDPGGKPVVGAVVVRGERPYREVGSQEVRTDDRGIYQLPPLPRGPVTITVVARNWMPVQKKIDLQPGLRPIDFRLEPGKALRVAIVDKTGKPVPGVSVSIHRWRGQESLYNIRHPNVLDTQIPNETDESGAYLWTWAPNDAVTYSLYKKGYVTQEVDLTATGLVQTVTLHKVLRITGTVTDVSTGRSIQNVTAIPVLESSPGQLFVERQHAKRFPGTAYTIEGDRTDGGYRVRIEADGFRTAMSDVVRAGMPDPTFDFRLEPAPPVRGRVMGAAGRPVTGARVYLATPSQMLGIAREQENGHERENAWPSNQCVVTDKEGAFSLPAQFERYTIVAMHDDGYAEVELEPKGQPGDLSLKAWAQVEGRLLEAGKLVPSAWITFEPLRSKLVTSPHIQDDFSVKTDQSGRFIFARVPPVKSSVGAQLGVGSDYPITSSRRVPLELSPGQGVVLNLGLGTSVTGRVVIAGDANAKIDLHQSLNYLVRKQPVIAPPAELRSFGFDVRKGWNPVWKSTPEGLDFLKTLDHFFVTLDRDGRFRISGVPAGDYDLAINLYEAPVKGCLVNTAGTRVVSFRVTEEAARQGGVDLGDFEVGVVTGPRVGEAVPDISFVAFSGETVKLSDLRGRYVLLDFWATWCAPCVAELPELRRIYDTYGADKRVVFLGLNLDDDERAARQFVKGRKLPWAVGSVKGQASAQALAQYAINFVPAYFLVGPDGKLIVRGASIDEIEEVLRVKAPRPAAP